MPTYECECCNFKTELNANFVRHMGSSRHHKKAQALCSSSDEDKPSITQVHKDEMNAVYNEISGLKSCFEECKQMFMELKNQSPTPVPQTQANPLSQPQTITINTAKPVDETCNPRYIEKQLNDNPLYKDTPDIDTFFLRKSPHIKFDFSEIEGLSDVLSDGKSFVIDTCVEFAKKTLAAGKTLPFVYKKGSWYIKGQDNLWEKEEMASSSCNPSSTKFVHSLIIKKFIFIIQNRFIDYWTEKTDGNQWLRSNTAMELLAEVFRLELYHNKEFLKPMGTIF